MAETSEKRRRLWITLSEVVGVLALLVTALNVWDAHHDRVASERRAAAERRSQAQEAAARSAFVLIARSEADGDRLALQPLSGGQAVQDVRFVFPSALDLPTVQAYQPRLELGALSPGLRRMLAARRRRRQAPPAGEGALPIGVVSSYVEAGELRTDRSMYRLEYAWRTPFLGGPRITLEGAALARRGVRGDLQRAVDALWRLEQPG